LVKARYCARKGLFVLAIHSLACPGASEVLHLAKLARINAEIRKLCTMEKRA
jgi:hypothetical protein